VAPFGWGGGIKREPQVTKHMWLTLKPQLPVQCKGVPVLNGGAACQPAIGIAIHFVHQWNHRIIVLYFTHTLSLSVLSLSHMQIMPTLQWLADHHKPRPSPQLAIMTRYHHSHYDGKFCSLTVETEMPPVRLPTHNFILLLVKCSIKTPGIHPLLQVYLYCPGQWA